jgi:hypothetical protein
MSKNSLNNLLFIVSLSIIGIVAIDFINCNFKLPFSILGNQESVVSEVCKNSEKNSYDTLIILLNTIIALKTRMED